jgi:hypothetical protein
VAISCCAGLGIWTGGYAGAVLMPIAFASFALALAVRHGPVSAMARSPWMVTVLVLMAAALEALGAHLGSAGPSTTLATALSNTGPQLLCLLVLARVLAGLTRHEGEPLSDPGGGAYFGADEIRPATVRRWPAPVEPEEPLGGPLDEVVTHRRHGEGDSRGREQHED